MYTNRNLNFVILQCYAISNDVMDVTEVTRSNISQRKQLLLSQQNDTMFIAPCSLNKY